MVVTDYYEVLKRAIIEQPWAIIHRLALADYLEEKGKYRKAEVCRNSRQPDPITRLANEKMKRAIQKGATDRFMHNWLSVWNEHKGVDRGWDEMWLKELDI